MPFALYALSRSTRSSTLEMASVLACSLRRSASFSFVQASNFLLSRLFPETFFLLSCLFPETFFLLLLPRLFPSRQIRLAVGAFYSTPIDAFAAVRACWIKPNGRPPSEDFVHVDFAYECTFNTHIAMQVHVDESVGALANGRLSEPLKCSLIGFATGNAPGEPLITARVRGDKFDDFVRLTNVS